MENNIQRMITEIINEIGHGTGENPMNRFPMVHFTIPPFININDELLNRSFQDQGNTIKPLCKKFLEELEEITIDNDNDNENKTCSICLEELKEGDKVIKLPCNGQPHYFHSTKTEECDGIIPWLEGNNTCPVCRCEFPEEKLKPELPESLLPTSNTELSEDQIQGLNVDAPPPTPLNYDSEEVNEDDFQLRPINIMNQIMRRVIEEERVTMMNEEEEIQQAIMNSIEDK